jgi:hypothetical protein
MDFFNPCNLVFLLPDGNDSSACLEHLSICLSLGISEPLCFVFMSSKIEYFKPIFPLITWFYEFCISLKFLLIIYKNPFPLSIIFLFFSNDHSSLRLHIITVLVRSTHYNFMVILHICLWFTKQHC